MLQLEADEQPVLSAPKSAKAITVRSCLTERDYTAWDNFVFHFPGAHYFQTYGWLKSYEPMGFFPHVLVYEEEGIICGGVAFLSAKVPLSPWSICIIPHGPLPADPNAPGWIPLMQRLDKLCREQRAVWIARTPLPVAG